jgi:uncharacterized protein with gpF-like domain
VNWHRKQSDDQELQAALARQELLMQQLEIAFERTLASKLNKWTNVVARAAAKEGTAINSDLLLAPMNDDLIPVYEAQYNRVGMAFSRQFWASISKSMALRETKDEAGIFRTLLDAWIESETAQRVRMVVQTTKDLIASAISQSVNESLGPAGMAKLIREQAGGVISARRAKTIARTETHTAAQFSNTAAAEASGVELRKIWVRTKDERVRPSHIKAERDSRKNIIKAGEPFNVGGNSAMFPGDPTLPPEESINCRCGVVHRPLILDQ